MKKALIVIATILGIICIGLDLWCVLIYTYGDNKEVSNTILVDNLTTADGSETKPFIEVNYYTNENENGLELFEIKFNYFVDENMTDFVSVGLQYVTDTSENDITWDKKAGYWHVTNEERYGFLNLGYRMEYDRYYEYSVGENSSYYEYQSTDDYATTLGNTINPIRDTSRFKISIGDDIYSLGFKFYKPEEDFYLGYAKLTSIATEDITSFYALVDQHLLAYTLFESMSEATYGSNNFTVAKFSNFFDYYKYDGSTYVAVDNVNNEKIRTDFENYYVMKINKYEDGATLATQSLFKTIKGDSTFNLNGDKVYEDYYYGRTIINVDIDNFDKEELEDGTIKLVLKNTFIDDYDDYSKAILLDIDIVLDETYIFAGFDDNLLDNFSVYDCSINGVDYEVGGVAC